MLATAGERQAEAKMGVVIGRARLDDRGEVGRRRLVLAGVELSPGEGFTNAAGGRLSVRRALQHLRRGGRAALAEQFHAPGVQGVHVSGLVAAPAVARTAVTVAGRSVRHGLILVDVVREVFQVRGIPASFRHF